MRRFFATLCAALGLGGVQATELPRIVVDDEHLQMQQEAGVSPPYYTISSGRALEIDARQYEFRVPEALGGARPNSVQLILEETQQFSAVWPPAAGTLTLSEAVLTPNPGSLPFNGLSAGQEGVLAIGVLDGSRFSVVWVGMFRVL